MQQTDGGQYGSGFFDDAMSKLKSSASTLKTSVTSKVQSATAKVNPFSSSKSSSTIAPSLPSSNPMSTLNTYVIGPINTAGNWVQANAKSVLMFLGVLLLIGLLIWYYTRKTETVEQQAADTANTLSTAVAAAPPTTEDEFMFPPLEEGFQVVDAKPVDPTMATLFNLQPLTISQAGYLGGAEGGEFNPEKGVVQALRSGFRAFVLQIDYLDSNKGAGFEKAGEPTLVYYSKDGSLISSNTGSIEKVTSVLAEMAYSEGIPNNTQPILLYLHILRTPNKLRALDKYIVFLSKIAKALQPLATTHLGLTPLGNFYRQNREMDLLTIPLNHLEGKTILLSNADTSVFRMSPQGKRKSYLPTEDLDYWINMRVYLAAESQGLGVTQIPVDQKSARAVLLHLEDALGLTTMQADAFAQRNRGKLTIAMPNPTKNPTPEELARAINELGINVVPLHIFGEAPDAASALVRQYSSMSYRPKPTVLLTSPTTK